MITLNAYESFTRPLLGICAALLLSAGDALAADRAGDAQIQARELLSRTAASQPPAPSASGAVPNPEDSTSTADASEQARRLLSGITGFGAEPRQAAALGPTGLPSGPITGRAEGRASPGAQAMAQRVILGASQSHDHSINGHRLVDR